MGSLSRENRHPGIVASLDDDSKSVVPRQMGLSRCVEPLFELIDRKSSGADRIAEPISGAVTLCPSRHDGKVQGSLTSLIRCGLAVWGPEAQYWLALSGCD